MASLHPRFNLLQLPAELQFEVAERIPDALSLYNFVLTCNRCKFIGTRVSNKIFKKVLARAPHQLQRLALAILGTMIDRDLIHKYRGYRGIESFLHKYVHNDPPIMHSKDPISPSYIFLVSKILEQTNMRAEIFNQEIDHRYRTLVHFSHFGGHVLSNTESHRIQRAFMNLQLCVHLSAADPARLPSVWNMPRHFNPNEAFELDSLATWRNCISPRTLFRVATYIPDPWSVMNSTTTKRLEELLALPRCRDVSRLSALYKYIRWQKFIAVHEVSEGSWKAPETINNGPDQPSAYFASALRQDMGWSTVRRPGSDRTGLLFWDVKRLQQMKAVCKSKGNNPDDA